ncbi:hypothetical protein RSAG8_06502, partial [Rhizoctonia solani AG-8 WAC10335]
MLSPSCLPTVYTSSTFWCFRFVTQQPGPVGHQVKLPTSWHTLDNILGDGGCGTSKSSKGPGSPGTNNFLFSYTHATL